MRLESFLSNTLFEATSDLLADLSIKFNRQTAEPIDLLDLLENNISKQLKEALDVIDKSYFVGIVDDETIKGNKADVSLEDTVAKVNDDYAGLLVFALDLRRDAHITRTILAALTRGLNRIAHSMPVVVVFRQNDRIALATCERTAYVQTWREGEKVGKVFILRDINCSKTHRGHIDILNNLECSSCETFSDMYAHWQEVFSSELLTRNFYRELQNWYFWAIKNVKFPNDIDDIFDDEAYNPQNTIRLITRLIFVWFIKHKHFIPDEIFDLRWLKANLKDFDENSTGNQYYRAVLQNLFFATLNQEISKRAFASDSDIDPESEEYRYLYLYEDEFNIPKEEILKLFRVAPFINGGLFECLDEKVQNSHRYYWDGFSENISRQAQVPNFLFFARNMTVDLSEEYDDRTMRNVPVSGLINIFSKYNFTVEENTPLDVDVALDPELLGKVFENLLAAYNPETKTTARKQTGSFYTPREIVSYMVDESLLAYLKGKVPSVNDEDLRSIISYHFDDAPESVTEEQRKEIIKALFKCKILDPACGSGAFPMGILQQISHILAKLDKNNSLWEDVVLDQTIEDVKNSGEDSRKLDEVKRVFKEAVDSPDYARKLYIIENCIYGVDIQSIAVQISRLRFFISLICEQQSSRHDPKDNYDILPLPNLETKFVAANTLIPLEKDDETMSLFGRDAITKKIKKLEDIRHRQFSVTNNDLKLQLRREDEQLREEVIMLVKKLFIDNAEEQIRQKEELLPHLQEELKKAEALPDEWENVSVVINLFGETETVKRNKREEAVKKANAAIAKCNREIKTLQDKARLNKVVRMATLITGWNPYDQNASSPFFDPEWMFRVVGGFDIVIGNPPYISIQGMSQEDRTLYKGLFKFFYLRYDLFACFIEKSLSLLNDSGILTFIQPSVFLNSKSFIYCRKHLVEKCSILRINLLKDGVFESAVVPTMILSLSKSFDKDNKIICSEKGINDYYKIKQEHFLSTEGNVFNLSLREDVVDFINKTSVNCTYLGDIAVVSNGINTGNLSHYLNESKVPNSFPVIKGASIHKWNYTYQGYYLDDELDDFVSCGDIITLEQPKLMMKRIGKYPEVCYDDEGIACLHTIHTIRIIDKAYSPLYVMALMNSKLLGYVFRLRVPLKGDVFPEFRVFDLNKQIPIKIITLKQQNKFVKLVTQILQGKNIAENEKLIDAMVFKLYGISYEEIKRIDNSFNYSEEEYSSITI